MEDQESVDVEQFVQDAIDQVEDENRDEDRVYIGEMARILGRYEHTVRRWVRESEQIYALIEGIPEDKGYLPRDLWPEREPDGRQRIYWSPDQIDGLKVYAEMKAARRGWHGSSRS